MGERTTSEWKRVTRLSPCPICGKTDWCLITAARSAVICPRVEEGSTRLIDGSGYLHMLRYTSYTADDWIPEKERALPEHNEVLAIRARQWLNEITNKEVTELSESLGVSDESVNLMNVGWNKGMNAWTFPMFRVGSEANKRRLLGIKIRTKQGKKFCVKGSKQGLFIPNNFPKSGVVYVCEGESDTASLLTCGLRAVGRPTATGGVKLLGELLKNHHVVVCMDRDGVGRKGANSLADYLRCHSEDVRMLEPPDKYKDMRDWLNGEGQEQVYSTAIQVYG